MQEIATIRGMVIPSGWDHNGRPTEVVIAAFDENEYHVEVNAVTQSLFYSIQKVVLAQGRLHINHGRKYIEIMHYKVLK